MKIIITSGGTTEKIDDVRMITNISTGKLGSLIANEFYKNTQNIEIIYICSHNAIVPNIPQLKIIKIVNVDDLQKCMIHILSNEKIDAVIHAMAVSDYSVRKVSTAENLTTNIIERINQLDIKDLNNTDEIEILKENILDVIISENDYLNTNKKINSNLDNMLITMNKTPKIINIIKSLQPTTVLVGFKLLNNVEHQDLIKTAYGLLIKNHCDFVLANDLVSINENNHIGFLVNPDRIYEEYNTKEDIAKAISYAVLEKCEVFRK